MLAGLGHYAIVSGDYEDYCVYACSTCYHGFYEVFVAWDVYYSYFDTAVNGFLMREAGLDYRASAAVGVVAETGCQFHGEIAFPDILDIGIRVRRLGNSSVTYEIGIFRQGRDEPAATGHFVHVYVAQGEMKPVPIPDSARAALEKLVVEA